MVTPMKHSLKPILRRAALGLTAALLLLVSICPASQAAQPPADAAELNVLFTHDTHSHLDSFVTVEDGQASTLGGFARIKTLIDEAVERDPDTLILDAGDFSMGTLVQTIYDSEAAELRMLGSLGCDVTTLGNHEFDYRSAGLAGALNAAAASGEPVPSIVLCNVDWKTMEAEGLSAEQQLLKDAFDTYGFRDYTVVTKGGLKIAVLGVFGVDSLACAPTCVLKFRDASEAAAETVAKIRAEENVDMIVCVSHSGTSEDEKKSEDEILAKNVPDIDLIISGHTHTTLTQPIRHGNTYIVSCGEYGKNLGSLSMSRKSDGRWEMTSYSLIPILPEIASDQPTQEKIDSFMEIVDSSYLSRFGYTRDRVLAQNDIVFATSEDLYYPHTDHNLGNLLSDSFQYAVDNADTGDSNPVAVALVPSGCVRDTFAAGDITVEDVFNAYSLGIGLDGVAGYPLISMYLTGAELKTGAEIDASVSDLMTAARLYTSGMSFTFNPHRIILNKITDCYLTDESGNRVEIEDDRLYRVVCDLYSGQMLGAVTDVSFGILSIQPKFADGTPIENIEDAIIVTADGQELKAWVAIAEYLETFADTDGDGIPNVPALYGSLHGRKVVEDSRNLLDLIRNPNKYAVIIVLVVLLLLVLLALLILLIVKLVRRIMRKKGNRRR
ncbi:MAG: bifunctional metallophosphatase/5'-nucleotidase [Roseburia sp.]|nr:bifunctional metallophosphatase/5'-nucleotidase [Roseburia sp.]MCM1098111.1 bifunctional metallophosphatase/5'-nucleotidase [Ruminococcus flavefaciens]